MKFRRKAAKKDYTFSFLPHDRKDAFKDIIKNRYSLLIKTGLVMFLFALPYFVGFAAEHYLFLPKAREVLNDTEYANFVISSGIIFDAIEILTITFASLGIAGLGTIYRKICWQEGIFFSHDFKISFKENWLQFMIISLMFGVFKFAVTTFARFEFPLIVKYIPLGIFYITTPIFIMALSIGVFYKTNIISSLRDGFVFCVKKYIFPLLFGLIVLALRIAHILVINGASGFIFLLNFFDIVFVILILPIYIIGFLNYSLTLFDEHTNRKYYPDYYHKGLADSSLYKGYKPKN